MRIVTAKRIQAARDNGRKSKGPVTPEGREKVKFNAVSHGLTGRDLILTTEDQQAFHQILAAYRLRFQPLDQAEDDLTYELSSIRWRQRRIWSIETATLDHAMDRMAPEIERTFTHIDSPTRTALGFQDLADNHLNLELLRRYDTGYRRAFDRTLANLHELQDRRLAAQHDCSPASVDDAPEPQNAISQNEPKQALTVLESDTLQNAERAA